MQNYQKKSHKERVKMISAMTAQTARYASPRFSANNDKKTTTGDLANLELAEAKAILDEALRPSGFKLDEAKYLILSSARNLFVITPQTWTFAQDAAFEKAFTAALKNLPANFPLLRKFADGQPNKLVFEREITYRPS